MMEMNQQQQQALEGFFDAIEDNSRNVENDDHDDDDVIRRRRISSDSPAIKNGREYPNILSFDQSGFEMMNCPTTLTTGEFYAAQYDDSIQRQYFDEVISYVEQKLGCDKVVCLQMELQQQQQQQQQQPRNHNDDLEQLYKLAKPQTATSSRVADEIAISLAGEHHRYQRYALVSLFRYVEDEDVEHLGQYRHMAILDERSAIKPDDYIPKERVRVVENGSAVAAIERYYSLSPRHAQGHKWYYFPNMKMHNDAILLKHMDSDWTKPSRMCFQMNNIVADPTTTFRKSDGQEGMCFAPTRTSVEVRMVCFWETPDSGINSMPSVQQSAVDHRSSAYHDSSSSSSICRLENSWLGKWMHGGDTKVHEWLGKIEELSAGLIDGGGGTDSLSFTELVGRATKCQSNTTVAMSRPLDLNDDDDNDGLYHPVEAYYGRYTREYSDGYDEEYRIQYLNKFLEVVDSFPTWPPSSKSWVRNEMRRFGHREVDRGIAEITCVIVDDSVGLVGTKNFPPEEKRNIIDFLIRNETYMHVAMTHWAQLAYDMPLQNQQSIIEEEEEEEEEDPSAEEAINDPIVGGPDQSAPMADLQGSPFEDPMTSNQHPPQYRDDMPAAPPSSLPPPMIANGLEGRLPNPPTMAHPVPTALRRPKYASMMQQDFIPEEEQYNMMRDVDGYYYHHPSDLRVLHLHQQQWQRQPPNQQRMTEEAEEGSYALWREQQQQQQEQHRRRKESRNRRRHRRQQDYHLNDDDDDDDAEGVSLIGAFCQPPTPTIPRHQYQQRAEDRRQQRERRRSMARKQQLSSDDTRDQYDEVESSRSNSPNSDRYSEGEESAAVTKTYLHEDDRSLMYSEEDDSSSLGNYYPEGRTTTMRDVGGTRMMTMPPKTRRESPEYDTPTIVGRENYYDDSNYYTKESESSYYHHRHQQYSRHSPRTQQQQRAIRHSISNSSGRSSYYYDGNEDESELLYTYSSNSPTYANKQQPPQLMPQSPSPEMLIMENSSQPSI